MHHDEKTMTSPPRYLRATAFATLGSVVIPVVLAVLGAMEVRGGPAVSGAEAQGGVIFAVHAVVAVLYVALAFPLAAWLLFRTDTLSKRRFYKVLFLSLIGVSLVPASLLAVVGFGWDAFYLAPFSFVVLGLLALPFRPVWLRFAW
jgi:hypothetical protein